MEELRFRKRNSRLSLNTFDIPEDADPATYTTPTDQKPRHLKNLPYQNPQYREQLEQEGSFMRESELGITEQSENDCLELLSIYSETPEHSIFDNFNRFQQISQTSSSSWGSQDTIIRQVTPFIVPSVTELRVLGAENLGCLTESHNAGWNSSRPLIGARPQPDYSVGFQRDAFTDEQLTRMAPCIGDESEGDISLFMGTWYMYFPFFSCEVKGKLAALHVADCQNAHSMTLAVRAVAKLFRAVKREDEVHRHILAFSISHTDTSVQVYGHYPVIDGQKNIRYYRHLIRAYDIRDQQGVDRWTSYRFTRNLYEKWAPSHLQRICSAIDMLDSGN